MVARELICLVCPRGCRLTIDREGNVTGNFCARGVPYAQQEISNPKRNLAFAIRVKGRSERLPVKTDKPIRKDLLVKLAKYLEQFEVDAPISFHAVLIANIFDTDVNIIATKSVI